MRSTRRPERFDSRPLPAPVHGRLTRRLRIEHRRAPFSPTDPRASVRRVVEVGAEIGVSATVIRGALDLRGTEVDHVWASVDGVVVDVAFPVRHDAFVDALRRFVAGEVDADALADAAEGRGLDDRVLGVFPAPLGYLGSPVWSARGR